MCGISAAISRDGKNVAGDLILSMVPQGYRGEKRCGIAISCTGEITVQTGEGLAFELFKDFKTEDFPGCAGIAHNSCHNYGSQPFCYRTGKSETAYCADAPSNIVHDLANIINGSRSIIPAITKAMREIDFPFALLVLRDNQIIAARSSGLKPLAFGQIRSQFRGFYAASQNDIFDGAKFLGSVLPGEMVILSRDKPRRIAVLQYPNMARCLNELIFLRRPDKEYSGHEVAQLRRAIGRRVGKKFLHSVKLNHSKESYVIIPILEGGKFYGFGVADETGIFYNPAGMYKPLYRRAAWMPKYLDMGFIAEVVKDKNVILVTDQVHSGHELQLLTDRCRLKGAKEVHAVAAAMMLKECPFENDFDHQKDPIGARMDAEQICSHLHLDSLTTLDADELVKSIKIPERIHCAECLQP